MILDCRGRDFDTTIIYYGREPQSNVDPDWIRNHTWKLKNDGHNPRDGYYCTPQEFYDLLSLHGDGQLMSTLNINFRNVQYISSGGFIYWVFCMRTNNLYKFKFIGKNVSSGICEYIMHSNGFELGYIHTKKYVEALERTEVWYNPEKILVCLFRFIDGIPGMIEQLVYYRHFENDVCSTVYTNCVFETNNNYILVPLTTKDEWDDIIKISGSSDILPWTYHVAVDKHHMLNDMDFDRDIKNERFSMINYTEMLETIFNHKEMG